VELERVNPPSLPRPSGFSHAVVTTGGRLVFLAGQIAHGADGAIVGDTIVAQFELDDYREHGRELGLVWQRLAGRDYPAMAGVGVSRLWHPDALVEIQGYAVIG